MYEIGSIEDFKADFNLKTRNFLGKGGFASVFSYESLIDKKRYAVKEFTLPSVEEIRDNMAEFLAYYKIPIVHPNIVALKKIYFGEE